MWREFRDWERGRPPGKESLPPPPSSADRVDSETDDEGWDTDSDSEGGQGDSQVSDPEDYEG